MTNQPDIIERVKELMKERKEIFAETETYNAQRVAWLTGNGMKIFHEIPAIAEALLIAVEALDHLGKTTKQCWCDDDLTCCICQCNEALSRIRHSPSQQ